MLTFFLFTVLSQLLAGSHLDVYSFVSFQLFAFTAACFQLSHNDNVFNSGTNFTLVATSGRWRIGFHWWKDSMQRVNVHHSLWQTNNIMAKCSTVLEIGWYLSGTKTIKDFILETLTYKSKKKPTRIYKLESQMLQYKMHNKSKLFTSVVCTF